MLETKREKPRFFLGGPTDGPPTLDDIVALFRAFTGREPDPDDVERARKSLEEKQPDNNVGDLIAERRVR